MDRDELCNGSNMPVYAVGRYYKWVKIGLNGTVKCPYCFRWVTCADENYPMLPGHYSE